MDYERIASDALLEIAADRRADLLRKSEAFLRQHRLQLLPHGGANRGVQADELVVDQTLEIPGNARPWRVVESLVDADLDARMAWLAAQ